MKKHIMLYLITLSFVLSIIPGVRAFAFNTIVELFADPRLAIHGFLRDNEGSFTTIDVPGSTGTTEAFGINPPGRIVGLIIVSNGPPSR